MGDELGRIAERVRQNRTTQQQSTDESAATSSRITRADRGGLVPGAHVLDVISGLDGLVSGAGTADKLQRGDVSVLLDDGRLVIRVADSLIVRPAPPRLL